MIGEIRPADCKGLRPHEKTNNTWWNTEKEPQVGQFVIYKDLKNKQKSRKLYVGKNDKGLYAIKDLYGSYQAIRCHDADIYL